MVSIFGPKRSNSSICIQKLRSGWRGGLRFTKSLDFNGVDTQLVTLNALPAGELHFAFWVKWDTALTAGQYLWSSSDGLATATAYITGGKSADGGPRDRKTFEFHGPPPTQSDGTTLQARGIWDLWVFTRDAANTWTIDTAVSRDVMPVGIGANPAGLTQLEIGLSLGWTSPFRMDARWARGWLTSGAGSFASAAQCNAWRLNPKVNVDAFAHHHWNPGDTPGDSTILVQDTIGSWDFAGAGGLTYQNDVP